MDISVESVKSFIDYIGVKILSDGQKYVFHITFELLEDINFGCQDHENTFYNNEGRFIAIFGILIGNGEVENGKSYLITSQIFNKFENHEE